MNLEKCKHIRIRDGDGYEINIEQLVKSIESEYKTDFTRIKDWKELLLHIENKKQQYDLKIKSANNRKKHIIDKLRTQYYRPSPFSLTSDLARTAHIWEAIKLNNKRIKELQKEEPSVSSSFQMQESNYLSGEISDMKLTAHPNSEIIPSENLVQQTLQSSPEEVEVKSSLMHLPVNICTNQHKNLSPLESQFSYLNTKRKESDEMRSILESHETHEMRTNQSQWIICNPSTIEINTAILEKQVVMFSLTNSSLETMYVRFKTITDTYPFKKISIYPETPVKLYPGLSKLYKFVFKLVSNMDNVNLYLIFRIGRNLLSLAPNEVLSIPVCLKSPNLIRVISVTKNVNIKPVYSWQININTNFPSGILKVSVDDHYYYMYVKKRDINFVQDSEDHAMSIEVTGVNTDSLMQKIDDENFEVENKSFNQMKKDELENTEMGQKTIESKSITTFLSMLVEEIVDLALETFIFQKTFLYLHPNCSYKIPVLFSKAERVGCHQCYYDLEFYDFHTESLVTTKTIKIFAEIAPHPIQIRPTILDMSESPINYGFREDRFVITNTHKFYPVTLKVKMTKEMKRLFRICPMEMTIPYESSAPFLVRVCATKIPNEDKFEELVHFTIKIVISGHDSVYRNVPPFFYELILPCALEYYKMYGQV